MAWNILLFCFKLNETKREGVGTSNFTTTTGVFFHNVESPFLVDHYIEIDKDHYYENHNVK